MIGLVVVTIAMVVGGLIGLWWCGERVVQYTVEVAQAFKISTFFAGFVILAIAADIPEIAVALTAAFKGASGISAGNLLGGNFVDVAFVIGLTLIFAPSSLILSSHDKFKLAIMLGLTSLILLMLLLVGSVGKVIGFCLIGVYIVALLWMWKRRDVHHDVIHEEVAAIKEAVHEHKSIILTSRFGLLIKLGMSFIGVLYASSVAVGSALDLAAMLALPAEVIGATLLAVGTSLPEFVISFTSMRRGHDSLALGPTLGTVLEQSTLILGILAMTSAKPVMLGGLAASIIFSLLACAILCYSLIRYEGIGKGTGMVLCGLLIAYGAYFLT